MTKVLLYFYNIGKAACRLPKAILGLYYYHPTDGYVKNVLVTLDLFGNTLAGGDPDETISSRSGKAQRYEQGLAPPRWGWGCRLCSFLAVFQQDHCKKAVARNVGRNGVIPDE
jgi:hypothetical protein